ncbi:MAG: DHH family phosphoesterase [Chitinophagaceae bacterium]|nr:DHH family phosphoesterase [Chitinophagaceae bacterium]
MNPIEALADQLSYPRKITITHHFNPDADALGSSLGLMHYLQAKGHNCKVISPNTMPEFLKWMPGANEVLIYELDKSAAEEWINESDMVFSLDYNHFSRTKIMEQTLASFKGIRVMMDHHLFPDLASFDYGVSTPLKSSTCEMVYDFINLQGDNSLININIGKCLYAGCMTDTGSFKFPCTTGSVHRMVADLMDRGLETAPIHQAIFDTYQENRLRFLGYVLSEKMIIFPEQHTALIAISREELNKFHISTGDTEGIVNYPLSLNNIIFSTFISEREAEMRISFRSKGNFNVNDFARSHFAGGGHANAAGGRSELTLTQTVEQYIQIIHAHEKQLQQCFQELQASV